MRQSNDMKITGEQAMAVLQRMMNLYGFRKDVELARLLGIAQSTVPNWRRRESVPYWACVKVAESKKCSIKWLLTGKEAEEEKKEDSSSQLQLIQKLEQVVREEKSNLFGQEPLEATLTEGVRLLIERLQAIEDRLNQMEQAKNSERQL